MRRELQSADKAEPGFIYLFIYFNFYSFIYSFLAVLGLCCCTRAFFSSCGERGLLFVAVRRLLIPVAPLIAEHNF